MAFMSCGGGLAFPANLCHFFRSVELP